MTPSSLSLLPLLLLLLLASSSLPILHSLSLPNAISSNMVLQRAPQSSRLWGTASPSSTVTVHLDQSPPYATLASATGEWVITLTPHPASVNHSLTITADSRTVTLTNVAFGDVYLCSGQSNMEYALRDSWDGNASIADATHYPHLRLFTIAKAASLTPLTNTTNRWRSPSSWVVTSPQYLEGPSFAWFSAVCYYFGRPLYTALNANASSTAIIPIGLIDSCWSASLIEAWTREPALESCGPIRFPAYNSSIPTSSPRIGNANSTALFYGMVAPILHMALQGVVWYQGESNANDAPTYECRLPAMIQDWREAFGNWRLSFYTVLLTALKSEGVRWAVIRQAQIAGTLSLPYTAVSSGVDLGDQVLPPGPEGAGHSRNKTMLGERLALVARRVDYGEVGVVTDGPKLVDVVWPEQGEGGGVQVVVMRFRGDQGDVGLIMRDTSDCDVCCGGGLAGSPATVRTSDGRVRQGMVSVYPAAFTVLVAVDGVGGGVGVEGLAWDWNSYSQCTLYNAANLPILPFNLTRHAAAAPRTLAAL